MRENELLERAFAMPLTTTIKNIIGALALRREAWLITVRISNVRSWPARPITMIS
jgi:hypothetical protein